MKEIRGFGPPGTGKTTWLATEAIPNAVDTHGAEHVMVTSFTRAAAHELINKRSMKTGESIHISSNNIGTLHAICYRAFGQPELTIKHISEWNEYAPRYAFEQKSTGSVDEGPDQAGLTGGSGGDKLLNETNILRAKMIPEHKWPEKAQKFYSKWRSWKYDNIYMDFQDLIEKAHEELDKPPGDIKVLFCDEVQDMTPIQLSLLRKWGKTMELLVLVGDDDQTLYQFTGAAPEAFLNPPIDDKYKRKLTQSYRVPRAVFKRANRLIEKVAVREPKGYRPRDFEGVVRNHKGNYRSPKTIMREIQGYIEQDKSVMILASCAYMLDPMKAELKQNSIPFHNPYRKTRGDWNPLQRGGQITTATDLLSAFIQSGEDYPYWTVRQLITWASRLSVASAKEPDGLIKKKGKAAIKALTQAVEEQRDGLHTTREVLQHILPPESAELALVRDVDWLLRALLKPRRNALTYPIRVYEKFKDPEVFERAPNLILGTIHSVKGGESDIVYLFPDISQASDREAATSRASLDSLRRLFYVGMTRAREELILMDPISPKTTGLPSLYLEF